MEAPQCVERTRTNRPRAYPSWRSGWWKKGDLQDTVFGFEGMSLCIILDSSMVEHAAVNRGVVGSSPTRGVLRYEKMECRMMRGSVVKRLRHRPFTAVTRVRFPSESLKNILVHK